MGGVGGIHAVTLARFGFSRFKISDMDVFEVGNFNRQTGAAMSTVGKPKTEVMKNILLDINPEASVEIFDQGVSQNNLEEFLTGVDLLVDGLDVFAIDARIESYRAAYRLGVPMITAAPVGFGTSFMAFNPSGVSADYYFGFENESLSSNEKILRFLAGMTPKPFHGRYLAHPESVDLPRKKIPSTPVGCALASGVLCTNAVKILLNRGKVIWAPRGLQFDAYLNSYRTFWRPWGNKNPLKQILMYLIRKKMKI